MHRGFQFLLILDLLGVSFHAAVVFGLGKDFLFKSTLGHCVRRLKVNENPENLQCVLPGFIEAGEKRPTMLSFCGPLLALKIDIWLHSNTRAMFFSRQITKFMVLN